MKRVVLFIFLIYAFNANAETTFQTVKFNRCVDGDTAVFDVDGVETKYRFLAIDTPESVNPTKVVEEFGKDASEYTCNKLTNAKEIIIEIESSSKTDKYGRYLGWIWVDGNLLQKELISVGYAKVAYIYGKYRYTESLCLIQSNAKKEKYGLWVNETEDGYCSTVDLTNVEDNIDYSKVNINDNDSSNSKSDKMYDTLKKIDKIQDRIDQYMDKNEKNIQNKAYFFFIVLGIIYVIIKEFKK